MTGYDFQYNGDSLRDMGFIMVKPSEEDNFGLSRTVLKGNITPFKSSVPHFGTQYDDVLILNFLIVKDMTNDYSNTKVTYEDLRGLHRWLTSPQLPKSLYVSSYDDEKVIEYVGLFTDVSAFENDHLNGVALTFTCDSQYGYEYNKWKYKIATQIGISKTLYNDTDELNAPIYPTITIKPLASGDFTLVNTDTNETMSLSFSDTETYTIDCRLRRILKNGTPISLFSVGCSLTEITDQNDVGTGAYTMCWLPLYPGFNHLTMTGTVNITFEAKIPMKVGGYVNV